MSNERLVYFCRHDLRLEEVYDITRLIREVKIVQEHSSDTYAKLSKEHRANARMILSGYMLAWVCFLESMPPFVSLSISPETCLESIHASDLFQGSLYPFIQAKLTPTL